MVNAPVDVPLHRVNMPAGADARVAAVLHSGYIADGALVREFEDRLRAWIGNDNVVTVGDYSAGIALAFHEAGIGHGDQVIATPDACLGTNMPILTVGARPRWVDLDPATGNIDPDAIVPAITPRTKAIVYAHWGGNPADLDRINAIGREHGLLVVEDASEALGAEHAGRRLGAHGSDVTVFSFGPVRHLTTGEGAALAFADPARAERARWLKRYGIHQPSFRRPDGEIDPESDIPQHGFNTYMNNIAAAIGLNGFEHLDDALERHRSNGRRLDDVLGAEPGVGVLAHAPGDVPAWWVYTVRVADRDELRRTLRAAGIASSSLHLRNDAYSSFGSGLAQLPGVEEFSAMRLCLPCGWWVQDEDRERIAAIVRDHASGR